MEEPLWTAQQLEDLIHVLAKDSSKVVFTDHFSLRMSQRGITANESLRCLQRGLIVRGPTYNPDKKTFEVRMAESPPRNVVCVVAAVKPILDPNEVFAITVWEIDDV